MKVGAKALVCLLFVFSIVTVQAVDVPNTPFKHIIVVIQENRTTDNLFGSNPTFEPGVNIAMSGKDSHGNVIPLTPVQLANCYDLGHSHSAFKAMWDNHAIDGADKVNVILGSGCAAPANPQFKFVDGASPAESITPYFSIAQSYGFANYMFQTNQGPSFPAHLFLFSGTSAPVVKPLQFFDWFAAENATTAGNTGCMSPTGSVVMELDPNLNDPEAPGYNNGYPCYEHPTLADLLTSNSLSWRYYAPAKGTLWTAPNAISHVCQPDQNHNCQGAAFQAGGNVIVENAGTGHPAKVLEDIQDCNLPAVTWVIPDGAWSDHAGKNPNGFENLGLGASWVAAIVNAVGNSVCSAPNPPSLWQNTAILITWDDWGGWYDHVDPDPSHLGYSSQTGQQYVYGFRVPLLVVSAYTNAGYVSGAWNGVGNPPTACPMPSPYCHDFGSILNFIEYVLGKNGHSLGKIDTANNYDFADAQVQDTDLTHPYSLSDFFNFNQQPRSFSTISAPYGANFFINYTGQPQDPDDDASE